MPKMIGDKQMKRGDCEFLFSGNTMACKWMDNRSVLLLSSALEGMNDILSVQRREKSSKTKSLILCLKVVKLYLSNIGFFPEVWKRANIVPVHKKEDKNLMKNYRPVSLLPTFSKVYERVIYNTLFIYFKDNKLFTPSQ